MKDMIFAFMLGSGEGEADALRLARSIRTFGGQYCFNPIWMLSPRSEEDLSERTRQELFSNGARLVTISIEPQEPRFPFRSYVTAAGIAEGLAQGETSVLVVMATDTLVLQEPHPFLLQPGKSFGGCPVHLKLLGSGLDEPINEFWNLVYRLCQVNTDHIFSIQTIADGQLIRPYFNSGILVVRPERGLLRSWQANFERMFQAPEFRPFYQQSELYEIFMHQAVLSGNILAAMKENEIQLLPYEVNYPLHLHARIPEDRKVAQLSQLITCRYEEYADSFGTAAVQDLLKKDPSLNDWIRSQFT